MTHSDPLTAGSRPVSAGPEAHEIVRAGMINPDLDLDALATAFASAGRIQIENILRPEVADILHYCLDTEVPWSLAFRDRSGSCKLYPEELAAMQPEQRRALKDGILDQAREQFAFRYDSFMMVTAYKEKQHTGLVLHRVLEQLNSPAWLNAMRTITGLQQARRSDAQATRYVAGHFLRHHDDHEEPDRLVAFVLNLTRNWQADWGGLLQFLDPDGEVVDTLMPRFNTLSMFRVPADHCVSPVAKYATGARYAITGWLRT